MNRIHRPVGGERVMILIGQYDSPFVRRVAVAMRLQGFDFMHRPWSTFSDRSQVAGYSPLARVPVLVLDDGEVLMDSSSILDHLDEVAASAGRCRLVAADGHARRAALRTTAVAVGLAEKAVALVYERALHSEVSAAWVERCEAQIGAALEWLEAERAQSNTQAFWHGAAIGHADIAFACAFRFVTEAHPKWPGGDRLPNLVGHAGLLEAMDVFASVSQAFRPPRRQS